MTFGEALEALQSGKLVSRTGWNAHHYLGVQFPDANSANTRPYIYMVIGADAANLQGARVPWSPSQTDLFAEDWKAVELTPSSN